MNADVRRTPFTVSRQRPHRRLVLTPPTHKYITHPADAFHPCHYIQRAVSWLEQLELRTRDLAQHVVEFEGHREHGYRL